MALGDKLPVVMGREKGALSGVATLDETGILSEAQRPNASQIKTLNKQSLEEALKTVGVPAGGNVGDMLIKSDDTDFNTKWTPTNEQVFNAIKADRPKFYHSLGWWPSNKNLLINSDFRNKNLVINHRAQDSYTSPGYTIDRWKGIGNIKCDILDDAIQLTNTSSSIVGLASIIENEWLYNTNLTFSCLAELGDATLLLRDIDFNNHSLSVKINGYGLYSCTGLMPAGKMAMPEILLEPNTTVKIKYAKLELGTEQTLAHQEANGDWVLNDPSPQDYASELVKCQRYLMPVNSDFYLNGWVNSGNTSVHIPINLRNMYNGAKKVVVATPPTQLGIDGGGKRIMYLDYPDDFSLAINTDHLQLTQTASGKKKLAEFVSTCVGIWMPNGLCNILISAEL